MYDLGELSNLYNVLICGKSGKGGPRVVVEENVVGRREQMAVSIKLGTSTVYK